VGREMTIGKDTCVFQINRTNKMLIKPDINNLGWFQINAQLCHNFHFLNDASHHSFKAQWDKACVVTVNDVVKVNSTNPRCCFKSQGAQTLLAQILHVVVMPKEPGKVHTLLQIYYFHRQVGIKKC